MGFLKKAYTSRSQLLLASSRTSQSHHSKKAMEPEHLNVNDKICFHVNFWSDNDRKFNNAKTSRNKLAEIEHTEPMSLLLLLNM